MVVPLFDIIPIIFAKRVIDKDRFAGCDKTHPAFFSELSVSSFLVFFSALFMASVKQDFHNFTGLNVISDYNLQDV